MMNYLYFLQDIHNQCNLPLFSFVFGAHAFWDRTLRLLCTNTYIFCWKNQEFWFCIKYMYIVKNCVIFFIKWGGTLQHIAKYVLYSPVCCKNLHYIAIIWFKNRFWYLQNYFKVGLNFYIITITLSLALYIYIWWC